MKGGMLFPSKNEVDNPPSDGFYKTQLTKQAFQEHFKSICHKVIKRVAKFGTHCCRKTGYLFAIWAKGNINDIRKSARHKTIESAQRYEGDALFLLELAQRTTDYLVTPLTPWKPVIIENFQFARSITDQTNNSTLGIFIIYYRYYR
jgi:hypothetical protein